jgi:hypothetical protein
VPRRLADLTHVRRKLELAVVLVAFVALGVRTAYKAGLGRDPEKRTRTDVATFLLGADALAEGKNPFGLVEPEHNTPYVYPPVPALLFVPLRPLGPVGAAIAWYLISVGVFAAGVVSLRRARGDDDWVPLALVALPLATNLERGQLNAVLAGLVALGAAALVRRRDAASGAAIAASVAIKATPVLALAALARRPRGAGAAVATLALLLLALPAAFLGARGAIDANVAFADQMGLRYVHDPGSQALTPGARDYAISENPRNQSPIAILHRTRLGPTAAFKPLAAALAALATLTALGCVLAVPRDADPRRIVASVGVGACATLLAAPLAWHWHHVILYTPLAAVGRSRALWAFALLEVLHFAFVESLGRYGLLGAATLLALALATRVALGRPVEYTKGAPRGT